MRGRRFNKRVEIWQSVVIPDGFGGNTVIESLVTNSWVKIETSNNSSSILKASSDKDNGLLEASNSILVTLRKRNDITYDFSTMYLMYRGVKYIFKSYPVNVDFEDSIIKLVCVNNNIVNTVD